MEYQIVNFLNQLGRGTIIDEVTFYISWIPLLVAFWFLIALISLIFDKKNGKWIFWGTVLTFAIYLVINDLIIKQSLVSIFFRERPYIAYPEIISSGEMWVDSSMPSGHMSITVALLTFYIYFYHKWWAYAAGIFFLLLMAFARLHNGMHYPTDVLAGSVLGIGYGLLAILLINKMRHSQN